MPDAGQLKIAPRYTVVECSDTFPPDLVSVVDRMNAWTALAKARRAAARQHIGPGNALAQALGAVEFEFESK
eukprot:1573716-Alexandrium_andersonii.AAC.1